MPANWRIVLDLQKKWKHLQNAYDHKKLEDYISQSHLVGPNGSLTQQIIKGIIPSIIFGSTRNWQNHIGTNYCTRIETSLLFECN
jgi:hypothetical protein